MTENKNHKRPKHHPASFDGIVVGGHGLGVPAHNSYQPNRQAATPAFGDNLRRADGFHPNRQATTSLGHLASQDAEANALLDEPIVLDEDTGKKKKKHYYGHKHPRRRKYLKRTGLALLVIFIAVGGFMGWNLEKNLGKVFHGNILGVFRPVTKLKGEDQGRVTILVAGNSADDAGHNGGNLTDSIMLMSLDTVNNTGYILSIPRDLWVNYGTTDCSLGYSGKINAVYDCGQEIKFKQSGFPDGGMGLLEKVVEQDFGVNINYSALINYGGLRNAVNAVGGINFNVNNPNACYISGRLFNGLYDGGKDYATGGVLVNLTNGTHILNGQQALDLARARGDPPYASCGFANSDFTRTQNQRQEVLSLKSKALSIGVLSNPAKLSSLLNAIGGNVQTDFQSNEILRLYTLSKKIPNNAIQSVGLTGNKVTLIKSANLSNVSALIPAAGEDDYSDIQAFMAQLNSHDPVVKENASIAILNGSTTNGLASKTSTTLTNKGLNVEATATDTDHKTSILLVLNKQKPATLAYLQKTFKVTGITSTTAYPEAAGYDTDFVIILGEDVANSSQ